MIDNRLRATVRLFAIVAVILHGVVRLLCFPFRLLKPYEWEIAARLLVKTIVVKPRVETTRPAIYVANHFSFADFFALGRAIPDTWTVVRSDILAPTVRKAVIPWYIRMFERLMLWRSDDMRLILYDKYETGVGYGGQQTLKKIQRCLLDGHNVVLFPEGRSQNKTLPPRPFQSKIFEFAARNGLPIVPVTIAYHPNIGIEAGGELNLPTFLLQNVRCYMWFETLDGIGASSVHAAMTRRIQLFASMKHAEDVVRHPYWRSLMKTILSAVMFAAPICVLCCADAPPKWEGVLLAIQCTLYIVDMPYSLLVRDNMQILHHIIGLFLIYLRFLNPDPVFSKHVAGILFTEQGGFVFFHINALIGSTCAEYTRTISSTSLFACACVVAVIRVVIFAITAIHSFDICPSYTAPLTTVLVAQSVWQGMSMYYRFKAIA